MNKGQRYTKAFTRIKDSVGNSSAILEDLDTINELVTKETYHTRFWENVSF